MSNRNGLLLVVLTALLTLLLVLGVAFMALSRMERASQVSAIDHVRSRLTTRSGIEFAVARLRDNPDPGQPPLTDPADDWVYRETEPVPLERSINPSYHAGEPWIDALPNGRYDEGVDPWLPQQHDLNGNDRYDGWSGRLRGSYQPYGDTFKLRIEGQEGKIYINGGFLDAQDRDGDQVPDHRDTWIERKMPGYHPQIGTKPEAWDIGRGWNGQLTRMLDNLVEGVVPAVGLARDVAQNLWLRETERSLDDEAFLPPPRSAETLGTWLISRRPEGGFRNWRQVEQAVLEGASGAQPGAAAFLSQIPEGTSVIEFLQPYVTLRAWTDRVIHPHDTSTQGNHSAAMAPSTYFYHWRYFPPSQIRTFLQGPPEMEERAPIAVNIAPREVLIAALTDLGRLGAVSSAWTIPPSIAQRVADRIVEARSGGEDKDGNGRLEGGEDLNRNGRLDAPFRSWFHWDRYWGTFRREIPMTNIPVDPTLVWVPYEAPGVFNVQPTVDARIEILRSNFNPNSRLSQETMDVNLRTARGPYAGEVYKDSVFPYSTEWSFHPPLSFSIDSLGIVSGRDGELRSYRNSYAEMELFAVHRDTSQADFVAGRSDLSWSTAPSDSLWKTSGAGRNSHGPGTGGTVVSYPEPVSRLPHGAAEYDGLLGLATMEEIPDETVTFLHHGEGGWTAVVSGGDAEMVPVPENARLQADPSASVWDPENPSLLYPDGMGTEVDEGKVWEAMQLGIFDDTRHPLIPGRWEKMPAYEVDGNLPSGGRTGLVAFWKKDSIVDNAGAGVYDEEIYYSMRAQRNGKTQYLGIGGGAGLIAENGFNESRDSSGAEGAEYDSETGLPQKARERVARASSPYVETPSGFQRGIWTFLAGYWNIEETDPYRDAIVWTGGLSDHQGDNEEGTRPLRTRTSAESGYNAAGTRFMGEVTTDWRGLPFYVGGVGGKLMASVVDEIAIYDVHRGPEDPISKAQAVADRRFHEGRYYRWNDAVFTSKSLEFGPVRIRRVFWTLLPTFADESVRDAHVTIRLDGEMEPLPSELTNTGGELVNEAGDPMDVNVWGPIRYRVRFHPTPGWDDAKRMNEPLFETPFFDDITIVYEIPGGESVRFYEER